MKIRHKAPACPIQSDPVTPEYQAEVDRSTNKAMAAYERAQRRLEAAQRRLEKANRAKARAKGKGAKRLTRSVLAASEAVEARREELRQIEATMTAAPASAEHRGQRSYRPVPRPGRQV